MERKQGRDVAEPESLLVDAANAARLIGWSKSTFLRADAVGALGPKSIRVTAGGRARRYWRRSEIVAWVEEGECCSRREWLARQKEQGKKGNQK